MTKEHYQHALNAYEGGAINPSGILRSMTKVADAARHEVGNSSESLRTAPEWAPFRLYLAQLSYLAGQGIGHYANVEADLELARRLGE